MASMRVRIALLCLAASISAFGQAQTGTQSAQNVTSATNVAAMMVEKGSRWQVVSQPAAGLQATASKAAGAAGVRHVADCVSFSAAATAAIAAAAQLSINLRDGATGAGTVIWTQTVFIPASTGQIVAPFSFCGLGLVGTAATAMTLEFSALTANLFESVSISGYEVQ